MLIYAPPETLSTIPLVDLSDTDEAAVARAIGDACRNIGFFYIVNHGVPQHLIDDQFAWTKRFFDLPLADKLALHLRNSPTTAGYVPMGGQRLDSQDDSGDVAPTDVKEAFYCGMELPDDHPLAQLNIRNMGHNQWPAALPGLREQVIAYHEALRVLADRVLQLMALSLDLPPDWFEPFHDWPGFGIRMLRYPPQPENAAFNQIGAGAHTDWSGITLLAQDDLGGLEVRNAAGTWVEATPVPGSFIVNLGDLMARWTNGLYSSNMHRVKNIASDRDRYSVPFFYAPRFDAVIEPVPTCVGPGQPAKFPPCTTIEHMMEMFNRSYVDAAA